jgi:hypothetical protein
MCANCGVQLSPTAKFCSECGHPAGTAALSTSSSSSRFGAPETYTPGHLAEKILTSKAALKGERKQVTVLFADLKSSMELFADRDPEEARKLLDPVGFYAEISVRQEQPSSRPTVDEQTGQDARSP